MLKQQPLQKILDRDTRQSIFIATGIYLLVYFAFVILTVLFLDIMTLLEHRILSPVYLPG